MGPSSERFDDGRAAAPSSGRDPRRLAEILEEIHRLGPSSAAQIAASLNTHREVRIAFFGRPEKDGPADVDGRLRELAGLGWIEARGEQWALTKVGEEIAARGPVGAPVPFARTLCLAHEAHNKRVVSRLLTRMWEINPGRQGAVILADPPSNAAPVERDEIQRWLAGAIESWLQKLASEMPGFEPPASVEEIAQKVERGLGEGWESLNLKRRLDRLKEAMLDRLHEMLFGGVVAPRDLRIWQSRMEWAGLTLLARRLPGVRGRVWFPVGAFRKPGNPSFSPVQGLVRDELIYHVYTPSGSDAETEFAAELYDCYRARQQRERTEYVSLLAVRDHVCYELRIGNACFEALLQRIFPRVLRGELPYSMALEVDLSPRDRLRIAGALPVMIDGTPRYIIAMRQPAAAQGASR
ncbi:hypothetical protein [Sorangium sp. So ce426]|uniref:hypothetical protein n=1 Tax=Sorangium sp. So ce426 TaxID=3133312 RepID=UPI003F5CA672